MAVFAVQISFQEGAAAIAEEPLQLYVSAAVLHIHRRVDGAAHVLRHVDVTIRAESFAAAAQRPLANSHRAPARTEGRILIAPGAFDVAIGFNRRLGLHVDHAAQRIIAIERGDAARHDLHFAQRCLRHARPVNPASEGIVDGNTVDQAPARGWRRWRPSPAAKHLAKWDSPSDCRSGAAR